MRLFNILSKPTDPLTDIMRRASVRGRFRLEERIFDELDRRKHDLEQFDWDEQDRRAAEEERIELWRNEY